jgi:hypothetical protein
MKAKTHTLVVKENFAEFALLCAVNLPEETIDHKSFCGAQSSKRAIKYFILCCEQVCPRIKSKYVSDKIHLKSRGV